MNIKLMHSCGEAMTLLSSVHLPPTQSRPGFHSVLEGWRRLLQFNKETQKERLDLTCSFEKILNEATMAWCRDEKIPWATKHFGGTTIHIANEK